MEQEKYIIFDLHEVEYGINVQYVLSIERIQEITEVPRTPKFVKGVINLRGEIIPIIDLKERLHLSETKYTDQTRVLIVAVDTIQVGLIVDAATDVMDIQHDDIESVSESIGDIDEECLVGVTKRNERLVVLLSLEHILQRDTFEESTSIKR
ncbi:chemotaxis protein CheW [Pueribacillus sp. YX66]|uniref:chemotaxis protein CheW n=1 Tax=Pueribacillus sp. YX66 TaxID=3229242 RepID=UPI00358D0353